MTACEPHFSGNRHPLARFENETGTAPADLRLERMILALARPTDQQEALELLIAEQHDPQSPRYRQWLTPQEFGEQFGASTEDLDRIKAWLEGHGLNVDEIAGSRLAIVFSGAVTDVEAAFHTSIRSYSIDGERHFANAADPEILGLFARWSSAAQRSTTSDASCPFRYRGGDSEPEYTTSGGSHYLAPGDFSTIYNLAPLYQGSIDGAGQSIAVIGRCNIKVFDIQTFRSYFGLPTKDPVILLNGRDPGIISKTNSRRRLWTSSGRVQWPERRRETGVVGVHCVERWRDSFSAVRSEQQCRACRDRQLRRV